LKYVGEDQSLIRETSIVFVNAIELDNQTYLRYELENFERLKPVSRFFGIPRDLFYFRNEDPQDTLWYNNFAKKNLAENPAFLDTFVISSTADEMEKYLHNKKGLYDAIVEYEVNTKRKKSKVKYIVDSKDQYTVGNIKYYSNDPEIQKILDEKPGKRKIQPGDPIDANLFDVEKQRIFQYFQNQGYANFLVNNITLQGDSALTDKKIDVLFNVTSPKGSSAFQKYSIGRINVYTDFLQEKEYPIVPGKVLDGKNYFSTTKNFILRPRAIDKNIFLKSGEYYSRSDHYKTIRKLSKLSTYKFVKLTPKNNIQNDTIINYDIFLTPYKHRWISEIGSDAFYANLSSETQNFQSFGFSVSGSLINRNALKGSEQYKLSAEIGYELNNSLNYGILNSFIIPRQIDYFGTFGALFDLFKVPQLKRETFDVNTSTTFAGGYNYRDVFDQFRLNTFNLSASYNYRPTERWNVTLTTSGMDLLDYTIRDLFQVEVLDTIPLLENSYSDNVFTGLFFKEFSTIYTKPENYKGWSWAIYGNLELSGGEIFLVNQLYNALANKDNEWRLTDNIDFSKFFKIELDYRFYKTLTQTTMLASRINIGYASPYSRDNSVPYIKQFFVGGPNSIRAWSTRELGPGSYRELLENPVEGQRFYQAGDIKFEFSTEYRSDWIWIMEWALFLDGGNVWTLKEDTVREGSEFGSDFLTEIALGWGWGIRFDFTYFNVRFDFGYKLKDPYSSGVEGYFRSPIGQKFGNAHIAVNYPF